MTYTQTPYCFGEPNPAADRCHAQTKRLSAPHKSGKSPVNAYDATVNRVGSGGYGRGVRKALRPRAWAPSRPVIVQVATQPASEVSDRSNRSD